MREQGASYQSIANRLNQGGHSTSTGKSWTATAILRTARRATDSI
ncbi:recombinase family protein [Planctomicrobium sp. SH664]